MTAPTRREIAAKTARLERALGITPSPRASLEQRIAVIESRQGPRAAKPAPVTKAGRSNLSGDGERMDQAMGLPDRKSPIVEQQGAVMVMRAIKRDEARKHLEAYRARYGVR